VRRNGCVDHLAVLRRGLCSLSNHALNRRMNKPETGSERGDWTLAEVQAALKQVDAASIEAHREIRRAMG
jgi:hypothetical protein